MDSAELNHRVSDVCDDEVYAVNGLEGTGKCIPYIGWYWRTVNWDSPDYWFGDCGEFVGFMENNKWGHPYVYANPDQWVRIKALVIAAIEQPTNTTLQMVFDAIQALKREEPYE